MATYDVELRTVDGGTVKLRVEDVEDGLDAVMHAQNDYFTGGRAKLVAGPCPKCLDSGIELQPSFDSETNATRRLICECEHGKDLLAGRGPDNFTTNPDPDEEVEVVLKGSVVEVTP